MKTKLVKTMLTPLLFACALVTLFAATAAGQGTQGGRIQGMWETQITLNDCAGHVIRSFSGTLAFHQGGTLTEAAAGTAPALRNWGQGVWRHTSDSNYAFRFKGFTFNAQNVFTGWTIIAGEFTVDATGNAIAGAGATVQVYDPNGNLVASLCADAVGARFEL